MTLESKVYRIGTTNISCTAVAGILVIDFEDKEGRQYEYAFTKDASKFVREDGGIKKHALRKWLVNFVPACIRERKYSYKPWDTWKRAPGYIIAAKQSARIMYTE